MRLTDHHTFGQPAAARFFFTEDTGGDAGGGTVTATEPAGGDPDGGSGGAGALDDFTPADGVRSSAAAGGERVEGEKPPDFGKLFGKKPDEAAPKGETPGKAPSKPEKPAGGQPAKPATPPSKAAAEAKPPEKPATQPKPTAAAAKPPEKPAAAAAKPEEKGGKVVEAPKIPTDEEIDALQPKPGAPTRVIEDFGKMRASMKTLAQTARAAAAEKETLAKEVEALKASTGKLPEEVTKELEGLRNFHLLFNAQQDPVFQREYEGKIQAAEEGVFKLLEQHGLKPEVIKGIKDAAAANGGNLEAWPHWEGLINAFKNPLDKQAAINALQARREAIATKEAKLQQLGQDREGYFKTLSEKENAERKQWAKEMEKSALEISANAEWAMEKEIPADASAEVKAAIEAHNAEVTKVAAAFKANVLGAWNRDPKKTAELAFAGVKAEQLEKQLVAKESEVAKHTARIKALEDQIAKIKSAGRVAHSDSPGGSETAVGKKTTVEEGKVGGDGAAAISNFFNNRR